MQLINLKKNRGWILALLVLPLSFNSCSKKEITLEPRQSISSDKALTSKNTVQAAVNSVYAGLKDGTLYGRDVIAISDALSDITRSTNRSGRLTPENNNNSRAHLLLWSVAYELINEANLILEAIPSVPDASATDKSSWEGQLKFLRGLLYFELVRAYAYIPTAVIAANDKGGVPVKLTGTTSSTLNAYSPKRETTAAVYDQIYLDLNSSITLLDNSLGNGLATKAGARALLSRVALYKGDWATCVTQSTAAIGEGVGTLTTSANCVSAWRAAVHPESIFEVKFLTASENVGQNTSLQTSFTSLVTPGVSCSLGGFGDLVPSAFLLTQLGITSGAVPTCGTTPVPGVIARGNDVRAQLYEWGAVGRGTPNIECTKFLGRNGGINLDNVPVIRISEMYLNRAEAYYMQGGAANEALALADLNKIITNRGMTAVVATGTALRDEILRQDMLEFAFEGHRFFDLKRRGQDIVKSPANVPFNDFRILAPIPTSDIDVNLVQNFGY